MQSQQKSQQTAAWRSAKAGQRQRQTETEGWVGGHTHTNKKQSAHTCTKLCNFLSCS
eukprot:COSAG06_NODE_1781_length_8407_cov_9.719427_2_plen_57_part_00